jgi:hypothetical protein
MVGWIRRALTRRRPRGGSRSVRAEEPDERLVLGVKFLICLLFCLTGLEIAHLLVLRTWNSEVFAGISGLVGTLTGLFLGQKT